MCLIDGFQTFALTCDGTMGPKSKEPKRRQQSDARPIYDTRLDINIDKFQSFFILGTVGNRSASVPSQDAATRQVNCWIEIRKKRLQSINGSRCEAMK